MMALFQSVFFTHSIIYYFLYQLPNLALNNAETMQTNQHSNKITNTEHIIFLITNNWFYDVKPETNLSDEPTRICNKC